MTRGPYTKRKHCRKGHLYTKDSTIIVKRNGYRQCRICWNEYQRNRKAINNAYQREYRARRKQA